MSDMGPVLELKGRSYISREASDNKVPVPVMKQLENKLMNCASNSRDNNLDTQVGMIEQSEGACRNLKVETSTQFKRGEPLEGTKSGQRPALKSGDIKPVHDGWDPALTESSSSFDSDGTSFSEAEVDPELFDDAISSFPFAGYGDFFQMRKKKLTSKWRKYIGPLMWRCKWVELQIKKFESQVQKYDREITKYDKRKPFENCIPENVKPQSLSFAAQSRRKTVMKRKKRRRAEDTEEIESYMSHHNLFSYFENKKSAADAACTDGFWGNQGAGADKTSNGTNDIGIDEELLLREFKDGGNSLEEIFWKIGLMQWQVSEMKNRAHKVLSENAFRFCSTENLSLLVPCNCALMSSAENPASPLNNGHKLAVAASPVSSDIVRGDRDTKMVVTTIPESADLRHGQVNHVAENIEIINLTEIGRSSRNLSREILIYNRRAKTNLSKLKEVDIVSTRKPHGGIEDHESRAIVPICQDPEPSTPKIRSISEMMTTSTSGTNSSNKRKRATRKAGFGKWNQ